LRWRSSILRKQSDKTYVAVSFINNDRELILNFIVVDGSDGRVILDVESPYDSLRMFLVQYKNWRRSLIGAGARIGGARVGAES
jgi:hypothetical protein